MFNPRNYAISIEKILGTPQYMTGEIENDPFNFVSSFLDKKYDSNDAAAQLIDSLDAKFAKYKNVPFIRWDEEDAENFVGDLKKIYSL